VRYVFINVNNMTSSFSLLLVKALN